MMKYTIHLLLWSTLHAAVPVKQIGANWGLELLKTVNKFLHSADKDIMDWTDKHCVVICKSSMMLCCNNFVS